MSLATLEIPRHEREAIPAEVRGFILDAAARTEQFIEAHKDNPVVGFVPSDYEAVYDALKSLQSHSAALTGNAFCEWGSGLGVIASLAAMAGFDAVGIEIDSDLVDASRRLARDHHVSVEFIHGSYVPDGHAPDIDLEESHVMTLESGRAAYEELGLDPDDFDCIFAYPWPGEDDVVTSIFDAYAARGAVLLTYHGQDGVMVRRKIR
jgi:hypothetical protein